MLTYVTLTTEVLAPEIALAAAVVRLTLDDLVSHSYRRSAARDVRARRLEPWLLILEAYPAVAERARRELSNAEVCARP